MAAMFAVSWAMTVSNNVMRKVFSSGVSPSPQSGANHCSSNSVVRASTGHMHIQGNAPLSRGATTVGEDTERGAGLAQRDPTDGFPAAGDGSMIPEHLGADPDRQAAVPLVALPR